jgi:hypothetical protein
MTCYYVVDMEKEVIRMKMSQSQRVILMSDLLVELARNEKNETQIARIQTVLFLLAKLSQELAKNENSYKLQV